MTTPIADVLRDLEDQTIMMSSPKMIKQAPAYAEVVKRGKYVVVALLHELERQPSIPLVMLLHDIMQTQPDDVPENPTLAQLARAWVAWGKSTGESATRTPAKPPAS